MKSTAFRYIPSSNMEDIIQGIRDEVIPGKEHLDAMLAYREQYGVKA